MSLLGSMPLQSRCELCRTLLYFSGSHCRLFMAFGGALAWNPFRQNTHTTVLSAVETTHKAAVLHFDLPGAEIRSRRRGRNVRGAIVASSRNTCRNEVRGGFSVCSRRAKRGTNFILRLLCKIWSLIKDSFLLTCVMKICFQAICFVEVGHVCLRLFFLGVGLISFLENRCGFVRNLLKKWFLYASRMKVLTQCGQAEIEVTVWLRRHHEAVLLPRWDFTGAEQ